MKDKYPKCIINIENMLKVNMAPFDFIHKFIEIKDKFDNYTELIWDDKKKHLKSIILQSMKLLMKLVKI